LQEAEHYTNQFYLFSQNSAGTENVPIEYPENTLLKNNVVFITKKAKSKKLSKKQQKEKNLQLAKRQEKELMQIQKRNARFNHLNSLTLMLSECNDVIGVIATFCDDISMLMFTSTCRKFRSSILYDIVWYNYHVRTFRINMMEYSDTLSIEWWEKEEDEPEWEDEDEVLFEVDSRE
jgi:hypothetical protein